VVNKSALLLFVTSFLLWSCGNDAAPENGPSVAEVSEAQARNLYIRKCSLCHGDDGKLGASKSPDLSISNMSLEERIALITYGKGTMPGQKGILNKAEIQAVARYVESFRN